MADFFDKLQNVAKGIVNSADNMVDVTKLNIKISEEKKEITDAKTRLGDYLWQEVQAGQLQPIDEVEVQCDIIRSSLAKIAEMEAEIARLRSEGASSDAAGYAPNTCNSCGERLPEGAKFCASCGAAQV